MSERASCLYFDKLSESYQLACVDDLCHGAGRTLCGLEHGVDFDVPIDDDYDEAIAEQVDWYYEQVDPRWLAGQGGSDVDND